MKLPTEYIPYINPNREAARALRDDARYQALQEAGVCSDSMRDMLGLNDIEYCYFLRMGDFMPKQPPQIPDPMNGDPSIHAIHQMLETHKKEDQDE